MSGGVGDYETIRSLGAGATGSVYLARHRLSGRLVAVKYLHTGGADAQALGRFRREAAILASLDDAGLVRLEELIEIGDQLVVAMAYVDGPALRSLTDALTPSVALTVIAQLGAPLDVIHDAGVVHRDLKPANVLVDQAGRCKITDFGVARFVGDSLHVSNRNVVRTRTGTVIGTPAYLSPEMAAGRRQVDRRADVYSLAVMAYQLLVGRLPFVGDAYELLVAHIETPPPPPPEIVSGFPAEVGEVLVRGLAKQPDDRFDRAGEFVDALLGAAASSWVLALDASLAALVRRSTLDHSTPRPVAGLATATVTAPALNSPAPSTVGLSRADLPVFRPPTRRLARIVPLVVVAVVACLFAAAAVLVTR